VAARLLGLADRDELVATQVVVDAGGDTYRWAPIGKQAIRGVSGPLEVYRLLPGA